MGTLNRSGGCPKSDFDFDSLSHRLPLENYSPSPGVATLFCSSDFSSNVYPEPWGEGMHEVAAGDPKQKEGTQWAINFFQLPNSGELCEYGHVHLY